MRTLRPTIAFLTLSLLAVAACEEVPPTQPTPIKGVWSGYLGMGENTSGQTTMTIGEDKSCFVEAEISGDLQGWGPFTLRLEGDLIVYNKAVSGPVTITRYRSGIDTVQTDGFWSGQFFLDTGSSSGGWTAYTGGPFFAEGRWGASKN